MPLIQAPQIVPVSSQNSLITDPGATNIFPTPRISSEALPYVRVGGTLYGERGIGIRGQQMVTPLITLKSDKEIADISKEINIQKLKDFKSGLISQGYSELAPNVLSKRINPESKNRKYDVVNIDSQTGDVVSNILGDQQLGVFQLQNKLSDVNWRRLRVSDRNKLESQARKLGLDIDNRTGVLVPIGYKVDPRGRIVSKSPTGGWFGTPEAMAMVQRSQHPELYNYAVERAIKRDESARSPAGILNSMFQVTPEGKIKSTSKYQDYLNMNLAIDRSNERKLQRLMDKNNQLFQQRVFSADKMNIITGNTDTAIKDKLFGKWNW